MRSIAIYLLTAVSGFAFGPSDFYPLQTNNQWIYQSSGNLPQDPVVASITQSADFAGKTYYQYVGLDGAQWLRVDDQGVVYVYDATAKTERVYISADGTIKPLNTCNQTGHVISTNASYSGALGTWQGGLIEVQYDQGTCADTGITHELYLPYVGLVQRTVVTIAGARTYDLVYTRLGGGVLVSTAAETSFTLALDDTLYYARPTRAVAHARLTLRHTGGSSPVKLDFTSGQEVDLIVRNANGEAVYQWSSARTFIQQLHSLEIDGEKNWALSIPLDQLAPGAYTAEGFLTNTVSRSYTAMVSFTIAPSI